MRNQLLLTTPAAMAFGMALLLGTSAFSQAGNDTLGALVERGGPTFSTS